MSQSLIIVESPSKARTIKKYLGKGFSVKASVGHIRDLPKSELGVDVDKGFKPKYVNIKGKEKVIAELKKAAAEADEIFLAPDPDREGEAIAWHIIESIKVKDKPIRRVLFNEITKKGIAEGLQHTRNLDENLFASQQTRRILDRLVGYKISPILWKKVLRGLSAGRVQSVAMRLVVERELEIEAFVPDEYWEIFVQLNAKKPPVLRVKLVKKNGKKVAIPNQEAADEILEHLKNGKFVVTDIIEKPVKRKAPPPFITSSMQQTASSQFRMAPRRTMRIAQQLYEGVKLGGEGPVGLITYMRTDSFRIADEAISSCRDYIENTFGKEYMPEKPHFYKSKKSAQDAHEAIRPTSMENSPEKIKEYLSPEQLRLYRAIWNRFVASQMVPVVYHQTTIEVGCGDYTLTASAKVETFAGHLAVYRIGKEETEENEEEAADKLPPLTKGDELALKEIEPFQKFTQPPARFSESTLIRELEEKGIGRPSTYASIITVIQDKDYVKKVTGTLRPTDLGRSVTRLLIKSFPDVMDVSFTAQMEERLDKIEEGQSNPDSLLGEFWKNFEGKLETAAEEMENIKMKGEPTGIPCDKCDGMMVVKYGRNGPFLTCSSDDCKEIVNFERDENNEIKVLRDEETDETCEKCGAAMIKKSGRWGPYLACSAYPNCKNTISLDKDGNKKTKVKAEPDPNVKCPLDEAPMILRTSRYGNRFYSCSNYPKCRGTKPFETDIPCPQEKCDGHLLEQLARKKPRRVFWGCTNYPDCEFISNEEPVKGPCKSCGHPILAKRGKDGTIHCPSCGNEPETTEAK